MQCILIICVMNATSFGTEMCNAIFKSFDTENALFFLFIHTENCSMCAFVHLKIINEMKK